jgi:hypothetical protein
VISATNKKKGFIMTTIKPASPYNRFLVEEIALIKSIDPSIDHANAFRIAAKNWANSPMNPRSTNYHQDK